MSSIVLIGGLSAASVAASGCIWDTGGSGSRGHTGTGTPGGGTSTGAGKTPGESTPGSETPSGAGKKPGDTTPGGAGSKPGGGTPSGAGTAPGSGTPSGAGTMPGSGTPTAAGTEGGTATGTTPGGGTTTGTWTATGTWTETGPTPATGTSPGSQPVRKRINPLYVMPTPAECGWKAGQRVEAEMTPHGALASRVGATMAPPDARPRVGEAQECGDEASQSAEPEKAGALPADQDSCVILDDPCADEEPIPSP